MMEVPNYNIFLMFLYISSTVLSVARYFFHTVLLQEQFVIMKPQEVATRSFKIFPTTDQALKYVCSGRVFG